MTFKVCFFSNFLYGIYLFVCLIWLVGALLVSIEIIPWKKNSLSSLSKELRHSSDLHFSLLKGIESGVSSKVKCLFVVGDLDAVPYSSSHRTVECNCWKELGCFSVQSPQFGPASVLMLQQRRVI